MIYGIVLGLLAAGAILEGSRRVMRYLLVDKRLDKQRDRDYPKRCQWCHLFPDQCRCESYRVPPGFNSPDRIRHGMWN